MSRICADCIPESYLHELIVREGTVLRCDFCESTSRPTIELSDLAEKVHSVLEDHYEMTSPVPEGADYFAAKYGDWEQPGEPITLAIMGLLDSTEELAEAIREYLSDTYDPWDKDALCDLCPYESEAQYEERQIDTYAFQESWSSFRREILSRSRFFNQAAKLALDHIFHGIAELETHAGDPVVRIFAPDTPIFRARYVNTYQEAESILQFAPESLGAPPGEHASAGRMNAEGISVFYGATDLDTCLAEIRAPVGSHVVSGLFFPLRELRVLDLSKLQSVYLQGSLFDPEYSESLSRVKFLKQLQSELSQPVMPGAESRDYLPTQVVAEYLGCHPDMKLDGVMFASSQIAIKVDNARDNDERVGKNIVLFSHASGLEQYSLPEGTVVNVSRILHEPDDPNPDIFIWERAPSKADKGEDTPGTDNPDGISMFQIRAGHHEGETEASIKLDMDSILVCLVGGVAYQTNSYGVTRRRIDPDEKPF